MRRRLLADRGKLDRLPIKKQRVAETVPSSSFPHWKVLIGWLAILLLDSMADFRFEFLYPAFMFLRNFYDSYRYQGLIFALLVFCLVVYLDLLCWTVLASPWLFLGASSCVWLEIIRSSDHSFSYSALTLWMLFLYVEVSFRLEKLPGQLLSFSRPFAAHCIGYPVVTMSFLIKHQIMHVIRQRQQKKIAQKNAVYFGILQKALPQEPSQSTTYDHEKDQRNGLDEANGGLAVNSSSSSSSVGVQSDRSGDNRPVRVSPKSNHHVGNSGISSTGGGGGGGGKGSGRERIGSTSSGGGRHGKSSGSRSQDRSSSYKSQSHPGGGGGDQQGSPPHGTGTVGVANGDIPRPSSAGKVHVVGGKKQLAVKAVPRSNLSSQASGGGGAQGTGGSGSHDAVVKDKMKATLDMLQNELRSERTLRQVAEATASKLELEVKKLKADLQASCLQEEETATRVDELQVKERTQKSELQRFKMESENLQHKLSKLSSGKTHDQASIAVLEKKLKEEEGGRQRVERELREHLDQIQNLCSEEEFYGLKEQVMAKERELESTRKELGTKRRQVDRLQQDLNVCHIQLQAAEKDRAQLQNSLGEESSMKMRLLKALSEYTRRNQLYVEELQRKNVEVEHLRQRLAEILAIVPTLPTPILQPPPPPPATPTSNNVFQPTTVTPFAAITTTTNSEPYQGVVLGGGEAVSVASAVFHPSSPQSPVATPHQPPIGSAPQFLTPPGNQKP